MLRLLIISAVSVSLLSYAGAVVLTFPGVILVQWNEAEPSINLTTTEESWFASIAQLASIPGSVAGGVLMERLGPRRLSLTFLPVSALLWAVVVQAVFVSPLFLIAVRATQGFINAIICTALYVYPCEIADVSRRGSLTAFADFTTSLGFLTTYLIGGIVYWRNFAYVIISGTILPCFIGVYFAPESPIWLMRHGESEKAEEELRRIRDPNDDVIGELEEIAARALEETQLTLPQRIRLLGRCRNLLPVLISVLLLILKETTGQFVVVLFVFQIFQYADLSLTTFWCSVIVGSTRLISNLIACILLNKTSRKVLIVVPSLIAAVSFTLLGGYYYLQLWKTVLFLKLTPLVLLMVFVCCYGVGIGPVSWVLAAEIQPSAVRSVGSGLANAGFNLSQCLVSATFLPMEEFLGVHVCFWIYAGGCLTLGSFAMYFIPETKGRTLAKSEDHWTEKEKKWNKWKERMVSAVKTETINKDVKQNLMEI